MGTTVVATPNALEDFTNESFTSSTDVTRDLYRIGDGPAVIVIHEVPGITPPVATFARRIGEQKMTAVVPDLFGTPGRDLTFRYAFSSLARVCVSREFTVLAMNRTSPIIAYLRELAVHEHATNGGPGVGVVGMCFTGGFALAMAVDPVVVAPVLSQPSLPFPTSRARRGALGLSDDDLTLVKRRVDDLCVMGLRFTNDRKSPPERFVRLREELGSNFIGVEIDSSPSNPWGYRRGSHSVLTEDYSDVAGSPTRQALDDVLGFLTSRLGVEA